MDCKSTFRRFESYSALNMNGNSQRTRLRRMLIRNPNQTINDMVGGEWLTRVPILLQTVTIKMGKKFVYLRYSSYIIV